MVVWEMSILDRAVYSTGVLMWSLLTLSFTIIVLYLLYMSVGIFIYSLRIAHYVHKHYRKTESLWSIYRMSLVRAYKWSPFQTDTITKEVVVYRPWPWLTKAQKANALKDHTWYPG